MKKVTIFGVGSMGTRIAYFLARNRDIARIRLVDINREKSRATLLDFLQANVALRSKIALVNYVEPKEIDQSDVVIVAAGVQRARESGVSMPTDEDIRKMETIATHIGHFTPQSVVTVLSQPAELFCHVITRSGGFDPQRVIGFPLLIYREWFRDNIGKLVGLSNEDVRISTVRTLEGEELVPQQSTIGGIPLTEFVDDVSKLSVLPPAEIMSRRLQLHHYAPAAVISRVTGEIVSRRRQVITAIARQNDVAAYLESKSVIGADGFENLVPLSLSPEQQERHEAYRQRIISLTRELS
ncbi:MAG: lactate/malate family dehydrogenase [Alkalispirochaetaceae bacterium]